MSMKRFKFRRWDGSAMRLVDAPIDGDMQFTGLLDKNGVEIYEGDIIKYVTQYYGNRLERQRVVEWIDDMQDDSFGEPLSMGYRFYGGDIEVIGNIYENPDLLTNKGER